MKFLKKKQIDTAEVQQDIFTGNGSDTEFTLTFTVVDQKQLFVSIDGLTQEPTAAYGVNTAGTKVVFTEAPPTGSKILIKYIGMKIIIKNPSKTRFSFLLNSCLFFEKKSLIANKKKLIEIIIGKSPAPYPSCMGIDGNCNDK